MECLALLMCNSTPFSAPSMLMLLSRYRNSATFSRGWSSIVIAWWELVLILMTLVFPMLILRPSCLLCLYSLLVFDCICVCVPEMSAKSSAKSRSSSCWKGVHCSPVLWPSLTFSWSSWWWWGRARGTALSYSCPVLEWVWEPTVWDYLAWESVIHAFDNVDQFFGYTIMSEQLPQAVSI